MKKPISGTVLDKNTGPSVSNRLLIGTPTRGTPRMEWVAARYGQIIPTNWSHVQMNQWYHSYLPLGYAVADAQNLIVKAAVEGNYEWVLLIEDDNVLPPDAFLRWNEYIRDKTVPVVSGLYYTRSRPPEPLVYRGRGTSFYDKWKIGEKVWCDGVPTGMLLIDGKLLKAVWDESAEYQLGPIVTRRVFETPQQIWMDPDTNVVMTKVGTSDLEWCTRVMKGGFFEKSGWKQYQKKQYPFLVDTNIFGRHVNPDGEQFP